ncbi:hypothetical protein CSKR_112261 [Clonorchis sinensis]|uniref:Uncharacterized protein n=1 Tax=Clonorchis sinensis TaxID=79923 RepID=A0A3R7CCW4_CLOSI|nr:hypothetical protein CSKR_112261 [Clonorchis sinensis]
MCCTQAASCFSWYDIRDITIYFHKGNYSQEIPSSANQFGFCERLTWNPAESLVCDDFRQLNVLHQAASCSSWWKLGDCAYLMSPKKGETGRGLSKSFQQPYE